MESSVQQQRILSFDDDPLDDEATIPASTVTNQSTTYASSDIYAGKEEKASPINMSAIAARVSANTKPLKPKRVLEQVLTFSNNSLEARKLVESQIKATFEKLPKVIDEAPSNVELEEAGTYFWVK